MIESKNRSHNGVEGLLVFESTNAALKTERALKQARVRCSVIPTPLDITSECGISLLLESQWVERARVALDHAGCKDHELIFPYERKRTDGAGR